MSKILDLEEIKGKGDILGGIDITGTFAEVFKEPKQMPGFLFLLCTQGSCSLKVHVDNFNMKKNSLAIIFPGIFFQIVKKSKNCRFTFLAFTPNLINDTQVYSYTIDFTSMIFEKPVLDLSMKAGRLLEEYFMVYIHSHQLSPTMFDLQQASLTYTQLILGIGKIYKEKPVAQRRYRQQRIMKALIRDIIKEFRQERSMQYYAKKICLTPPYVSTALKKMTGQSFTEIITNLVIHDAKAKLSATELSIQEISDSLNFPDISAFGKYFKRYTGMTPTEYRKTAH